MGCALLVAPPRYPRGMEFQGAPTLGATELSCYQRVGWVLLTILQMYKHIVVTNKLLLVPPAAGVDDGHFAPPTGLLLRFPCFTVSEWLFYQSPVRFALQGRCQ